MSERYPDVSVIVPTSAGSDHLRQCLRSLGHQSIAPDRYEVIVVDRGTDSASSDACQDLAASMTLRVFQTGDHGIAHAKNLGVRAARAPVSLFLYEGGVAHPDLLWQHVDAHDRDLRVRVAVVGHTGWSPGAFVTPLMDYVGAAGATRLVPANPTDSPSPGFESLRGGQASYKTEFLREHGPFDETFTSELEDVELGYRLTKHGLTVHYRRDAVNNLTRPVTLMAACRRAEMQGKALVQMAELHPDEPVLEYCRLHERARRWQDTRNRVRKLFRRAHRLEQTVDGMDPSSVSAVSLLETYAELLGAMQGRGVARALKQSNHSNYEPLDP
jgi:glycosyltransferase involved in cell wall biosynthesis